jgi:hypothetical protein
LFAVPQILKRLDVDKKKGRQSSPVYCGIGHY